MLGPLGYVHRAEIEGEQGERVVYLSRHGGGGSLSLREAHDGREQRPFDRYDLGIHHICFAAAHVPAWTPSPGGCGSAAPRSRAATGSAATARLLRRLLPGPGRDQARGPAQALGARPGRQDQRARGAPAPARYRLSAAAQ
ncbi:MAG: hypothetical protein ACXWZK_12545 [Solirubrobacterales bacterium]